MKPAEPPDELERLRTHNQELEAEVSRLRAELALKAGVEAQLRETLLELAELKRQIFGERSERLTPEEEAQLAEAAADPQEPVQPEPPLSQEVLEEEPQAPADDQDKGGDQEDRQRRRKRGRRHPLPEQLERQTVVLEPEGPCSCEHCGEPLRRIGQEVSEELDYVPAKVVVRRTVRPKHACARGCGGVRVAPLPPRLVPQSKLGLGLAVYLLLARFDDHVAYYTLERIFRERHGVAIARQQMVQWVEQIACLLHRSARRCSSG